MHNNAYYQYGIKVCVKFGYSFFCWLVLLSFSPISSLVAAEPDQLVICYRPDSAPMQFKNSSGEADGILIDYWKLWSQKSGIPVVFKSAYNKQAQAMMINDEVDINAGLFANAKRERYLDYSTPILNSPYHLYTHTAISNLVNLDNLRDYRVGVTRGSFHEAYMREYFPVVKLALYDGYQALFRAAEKGEIHIFISQPMYRAYYMQQHPLLQSYRQHTLPLYTHSYKAAVTKKKRKLLQTINDYMAAIEAEEKAAITRKWLGLQWHSEQANSPQAIKLSNDEQKWIANHKIIHMGGESNWPPFDFADEKGNYEGITSEYVKLLEKRLGLRIQMHYKQSWTETLDMLKTGKLDAVAAISKTAEREQYALFSRPYVSYPYVIITHEKNIQFDSLRSLTGKRIVVEKNFYTHQLLLSQFPDINIITKESTENAILTVAQGKADAYVGVQPVASYFIEKNFITNLRVAGLAPFEKVGISMAARTDLPVLAQLLQKGLDSITPIEKMEIQRKWVGIPKEHPASRGAINLSKEQQTWIDAHRTIRIGVDPHWPPIEYLNNKGAYSGIASEYMRFFETTFRVKAIHDPSLNWADVIKQIKVGEIDVLPAVSRTPEREQYLNFTKPYLRFPYVIFMRNDAGLITGLDGLIGKTIVVEKNYANHEILQRNHPNIKLLLVDNTEQALSAVSLGNADAYMGNLAATSHNILQTGRTNIKVAAPTPYSNDLAFAVRKGLPELFGILQQFLDSVTVEQANLFKKKWFSIQYEHKVDYALLWKTISVAAFVLIIISLWLWMLNKQKEALRISEERFRLVMNATQEGIWDWNIETGNVYYSPGFYHMLGYSEDNFPEKYGAWMNLLHPDDYEKTSVSLNEIILNCAKRYILEFRMKHKNGNYRNVLATGSLELNQQGKAVRSLGSLIDITEKKVVEEKIKQNELQLKKIIDTIPLAIVISDDDGTIIFANKQTEKEIGSDRSVVGLDMKLFYENQEDRNRLFTIYREKGGVEALPMRYKTLSGELTEGIISMLPVNFDGDMRHLGVLVNLTERIQMERELIEAKTQADIANKTKSGFLANMSHEIRTPMNAIIGLGHLVLKTDLNERQRDYIEKIQTSSRSLLGIINDILDFSKIEAGKLKIEEVGFHLEDVIDNLSSLVVLRAEEKGLEILFSIEPDVPLHLIGDPLRLGQILINLSQNAIKFTEQGEILIKICKLETLNNETKLEFSVTDTGIGIEQAHISNLFDAFSQVDETYIRRFEGTGLGLAICQQLVELMGGNITVKSRVGKGSTFSFQLLFEIAEEGEMFSSNMSFQGKRALVVDDNATARQVLTSMLESFYFEVESVASGEDAFNLIRRSAGIGNQHFDLVLIDWKMPGLNGIETSRKIFEEIDQPHIPTIIMVTAYGREEIMHQTEQVGLDGFLIKPVNPSLLFNTIMEAMQGVVPSQKNIFASSSNKRLSGEVLLVEDNIINQQVAEEILKNMGLFVHVVSNGVNALNALESHNFDLILTDIQMPEMDGYELTRQIRYHEKWGSLPIIAMTAHAMENDREKCLAIGMNDHVPKPIDPEALFKTLSFWLKPMATVALSHYQVDESYIELPAKIAGIDMAWGLQRIGGNKKLFCKLLKEFVQDYASTEEKIDTAIISNDLDLARRMIHTIQGIAGSIGARDLLKASMAMEAVLQSGAVPERAIWAVFLNAFTEVSTGLKAWLDSENVIVIEKKSKDALSLDKALLEHINQLLSEGNPEAEKLIARINVKNLDHETSKILSIIKKRVQNYDFLQAQLLISKLKY